MNLFFCRNQFVVCRLVELQKAVKFNELHRDEIFLNGDEKFKAFGNFPHVIFTTTAWRKVFQSIFCQFVLTQPLILPSSRKVQWRLFLLIIQIFREGYKIDFYLLLSSFFILFFPWNLMILSFFFLRPCGCCQLIKWILWNSYF